MGGIFKPRPVIFTDDGWIMGMPGPITVNDLKDKIIGNYAGMNSALWWSIGDHEVYHYETQLGETFADDSDGSNDPSNPQIESKSMTHGEQQAQNLRSLIDECGGPLTALTSFSRKVGLQFFGRIRMNSHYEHAPLDSRYGRFRREHPELLIGLPSISIGDDEWTEGSVEWGIRTGLNFKFLEVRELMTDIVCEIFERFDVDGVEMDFFRHPAFFKAEEAYQHRYTITDMVRHVRQRMNKVNTYHNKAIKLAVRVPATVADSVRIGLDVIHWIKEGLVDIVVVGGGHIPFDTPIREFVEAAEGTECHIYGCITASRYLDTMNIRALAQRFWSHGASGIYLYNFFTISREWHEKIYKDISDPATLAQLDKRYEVDKILPFYPIQGHGAAFRYASPPGQLPVTLTDTNSKSGPIINIEVNDGLTSETAQAKLRRCCLVLRFENFPKRNKLDVRINGEALPWASATISFDGWTRQHVESWNRYPTNPVPAHYEGASVEFALTYPPLMEGINKVEIRQIDSDLSANERIVLIGTEISIEYKKHSL